MQWVWPGKEALAGRSINLRCVEINSFFALISSVGGVRWEGFEAIDVSIGITLG